MPRVDILLVEDDPDDLEMTMRALRRQGIRKRIHVARDGQEALDFLFGGDAGQGADRTPGLVLLDLELPKVHGLEVLERIRRDGRTNGVPVILLTSSARDEYRVKGYQLGASSYLQKPVDFSQYQVMMKGLV